MRESLAWQYLDRNKPTWLAIERMEPMYPPGMADCFWTDKRTRMAVQLAEPMRHQILPPNVSGWLELKYCKPDDKEWRAGRIPKLRPEQPLFLRRQAANGVPCGILLRLGLEGWFLWRAEPTHEWVAKVRGNKAKEIGLDATMETGASLDIEWVIDHLLGQGT